MVTPKSNMLLRLYRHYQNNVLPFAGGILEQPAQYMRAMEIIEGALNGQG